MLIREAVERWGREHRRELDDVDTRLLRRLWSALRRSELTDRSIESLGAGSDLDPIVAALDRQDRPRGAELLNRVLRWTGVGIELELREHDAFRVPATETPAAPVRRADVAPTNDAPDRASAPTEPPDRRPTRLFEALRAGADEPPGPSAPQDRGPRRAQDVHAALLGGPLPPPDSDQGAVAELPHGAVDPVEPPRGFEQQRLDWSGAPDVVEVVADGVDVDPAESDVRETVEDSAEVEAEAVGEAEPIESDDVEADPVESERAEVDPVDVEAAENEVEPGEAGGDPVDVEAVEVAASVPSRPAATERRRSTPRPGLRKRSPNAERWQDPRFTRDRDSPKPDPGRPHKRGRRAERKSRRSARMPDSRVGSAGTARKVDWTTAALVAVAAAAAAMAALAPGDPTGIAGWDAVLKGLLAALVVLAASRAPDWVTVVAATVAVALVGRSDWLIPTAIGLNFALAAAIRGPHHRFVPPAVLRALGAGVAIQGLVRLPALGFFGLPSAIVAVLAVVAVVAAYRNTTPVARRRLRWAVGVAAVGVTAVLAVGGAVMLSARADVERGVAAARDGLSAARGGDPEAVVASLEEAAAALTAAEERLNSLWTQPLRFVPVAAQHREAVVVATEQGSAIARQASRTTLEADVSSITMTAGAVDLGALTAMETDLVDTVEMLDAGLDRLVGVRSPWLVPPIADRMESLTDELRTVLPEARVAADAARVVPAMLGADGPRRYVVLFGSPAESRELGGFVGSWALIEFDAGRVRQVDAGRTSDLYELSRGNAPLGPLGYPEWYLYRAIPEYWPQNLTSSPQLSIVTAATRELLDGLGGAPIDGLVYVDGYALSALLEVTGPVQVDGFDQRLTPSNAEEFFFDGQYRIEERNDLKDDLTEIFAATFRGLLDTRLPGPEELGRVLGPVARQGRLQVMTFDDTENAFLRSIKLQRAFGRTVDTADAFALIQANGSASKLDLYLTRHIDYSVTVDAAGLVAASVAVELTSDIPADAPEYTLGSTVAGRNVTYLSFYSPHDLVSVTVDGEEVEAMRIAEFGYNRYELEVEVGAGETRRIDYRLVGAVDPDRGYDVAIWHQPLVNADRVELTYSGPDGSESRALELTENTTIRFDGPQN